MWELTPAADWYQLVPWVLNHLPRQEQRVRYLKTFAWAMPERTQHLGLMVALGVDSTMWARLAQVVEGLGVGGA